MTSPVIGGAVGHHALAEHEFLLLLQTDPDRGLSTEESKRRLGTFGANELPTASADGRLVRLMHQLNNPLIYVLMVAGVVTAVLGETVESAVIIGVVVVNAAVGYIQEARAEAELDALRSLVETTARVRRDGRITSVGSAQLVPGDVVLLEAGDKGPADLRLLECAELKVDESALTGESLPVAKDEVAVPLDTPVADRRNIVYSGTFVTSGNGTGVVISTGASTELGEIHRLVGGADPLATPLTRRLTWFSKLLTVVILALAAVTFAIGVARGEPWPDMFTAAVALAVGAIPEGLPAAVTITLAIGVARMARRKAVIRRLPAVETLGSTTIICTDKTGTLTQNQMTVSAAWTAAGAYDVTGSGYQPDGRFVARGHGIDPADDRALRWSLLTGALCNDAAIEESDGVWQAVGDPTEAALLVAAHKAGHLVDDVKSEYPRQAVLPFSSNRKYMATQHRLVGDAQTITLAKGSVERILELCSHGMDVQGRRTTLHPDDVLQTMHVFADRGLRVLATAVLLDDEYDLKAETGPRLVFTGLLAMLDPPRPAAVRAVAACRGAGIGVKMITGDHAATAGAIAVQVGIVDDPAEAGRVITGPELDAIGPADLADRVEVATVFARVTPEQKLRLVSVLQERHHVVAMTGDGVNDAPALRLADIGVAMGLGGTEVAKEAADMVLTDDDFATIEAAVEEGRGVFDNLIKFIVWTLPTNVGEGLVILTAIALGTALPILPVQILWINMTTAVLLGLMLAFEPKEPGIMTRPPRDPQKPLLGTALLLRILLVSTLMVAATWWLFNWEFAQGSSLEQSRTAAINLFVAIEIFYLFSCRSLTRAPWRIGWFSNLWVMGGIAIQMAGQLAITYVPFMNSVFGTQAIDAETWARILVLAVAVSIIVAIEKRMTGRHI